MRSSLGSTNVTQTAMYRVKYINVVWLWLIYPAAPIIIAAILLKLTIWPSRGNGKMLRKSSTLALLFHGLPEDEMDMKILSLAKMKFAADRIGRSCLRMRLDTSI